MSERPRRGHEASRRYGRDDDVPAQGVTGIGIVALTSLVLAAVAALLAVATTLVF